MRLIDADALKKAVLDKTHGLDDIWNTTSILNLIDTAPTISDRYDEGYAQGYIDGSTGADWKGGTE